MDDVASLNDVMIDAVPCGNKWICISSRNIYEYVDNGALNNAAVPELGPVKVIRGKSLLKSNELFVCVTVTDKHYVLGTDHDRIIRLSLRSGKKCTTLEAENRLLDINYDLGHLIIRTETGLVIFEAHTGRQKLVYKKPHLLGVRLVEFHSAIYIVGVANNGSQSLTRILGHWTDFDDDPVWKEYDIPHTNNFYKDHTYIDQQGRFQAETYTTRSVKRVVIHGVTGDLVGKPMESQEAGRAASCLFEDSHGNLYNFFAPDDRPYLSIHFYSEILDRWLSFPTKRYEDEDEMSPYHKLVPGKTGVLPIPRGIRHFDVKPEPFLEKKEDIEREFRDQEQYYQTWRSKRHQKGECLSDCSDCVEPETSEANYSHSEDESQSDG